MTFDLLKKNKLILIGSSILVLFIVTALLVPMISPYSIETQNSSVRNLSSSLSHWFGTDKFGRDIFTRVWWGAGISLKIGFGSILVNGVFGVFYGCIAGYRGGHLDGVMMRISEIISAIPSFIYVILINMVMGYNVMGILLGICISGWIATARITRGEVMQIKDSDYIIAARLSGVPEKTILGKYMLFVAAGPVLVSIIYIMTQAIFTEAFLSFAGIGLAAPTASLGSLIRDSMSQLQVYPMQMVYPVLVLSMLILAVSIIGNGLEQILRNGEK